MIRFNPDFDKQQSRLDFSHSSRARLLNVLDEESAKAIHETLASNFQFDVALTKNNEYLSIKPEEWANYSPDYRRSLLEQAQRNATQGIGFIYGRKNLSGAENTNTVLDDLHQWLNSEETLQWARDVSGHNDIVAASAQATKYVPGHYLTRHKDVHATEQRRVAYVLSFTPNWHPDWGGLLQFYDDNGTPNQAWAPGYNSISIFDVKHIHSVTYVAPFAGAHRLSVTGWFRATPL